MNIVQARRDVDNCTNATARHSRHRALTVCTKQYPGTGFPQKPLTMGYLLFLTKQTAPPRDDGGWGACTGSDDGHAVQLNTDMTNGVLAMLLQLGSLFADSGVTLIVRAS